MGCLEQFMNHFMKTPNKKGKKRRTLRKINLFVYELTIADFQGPLKPALDIYMIFRYLWPEQTQFEKNITEILEELHGKKEEYIKKKGKKNQYKETERILVVLFKKIAGSIEIVIPGRNPELVRVWFPVIAPCHFFQRDIKTTFLDTVDRSNNQTKVAGLLDGVKSFVP